MAEIKPHPLATEQLPMFVAGPGETDTIFIVVCMNTPSAPCFLKFMKD
jgi:hypothetical protein